MYAKLIEGQLQEAPYYVRKEGKEIFGYNSDENSAMLLTDGWKLVNETTPPEGMIMPSKSYTEEENTIVCMWRETYAEPVLTYAEKRLAEYPDPREYLDAQVKINSRKNELITEGKKQLEAYVTKCLVIKDKYPKPVNTDNIFF